MNASVTVAFPALPQVPFAGETVTGETTATGNGEYPFLFAWRTADGRTLQRTIRREWIVAGGPKREPAKRRRA